MTDPRNDAITSLYPDHVAARRAAAARALADTGFDAMVVHSGRAFRYFADDQMAPHHPVPHFAHWLPLAGPDHLLVVRGDARPRLLRYAPEDYWYEQAPLGSPFWLAEFDLEEFADAAKAWDRVPREGRVAYIGDSPQLAREHGIPDDRVNPPALVARLDWARSLKTPYEAACVEQAARVAARGHEAARQAFDAGASEIEIHHAYVRAAGCLDHELPYPSIVALDEKGATLHYEHKRTVRDGRVLLLDSGATHLGYAADITRTWTRDGCEAGFCDLVAGLDAAQQELCARVRPGLPYPELHHEAHVRIADLLQATGVLRLGGETAVARGLTRPFFPHGLGHFLGIQVHDVAGHQRAPEGGTNDPPPQHPYLRTTRIIEEGQLFTIEPGIYFIEMLLRGLRAGPEAAQVDWDRVAKLAPCGGVRIEDNLLVTAEGSRNLTRPYI